MDLISSSANTNFDTLTPEGIRVVVLYAKLHTHLLRPLLEADKPPALVELRRAWPRWRARVRLRRHERASWSRSSNLLQDPEAGGPREPGPGVALNLQLPADSGLKDPLWDPQVLPSLRVPVNLGSTVAPSAGFVLVNNHDS